MASINFKVIGLTRLWSNMQGLDSNPQGSEDRRSTHSVSSTHECWWLWQLPHCGLGYAAQENLKSRSYVIPISVTSERVLTSDLLELRWRRLAKYWSDEDSKYIMSSLFVASNNIRDSASILAFTYLCRYFIIWPGTLWIGPFPVIFDKLSVNILWAAGNWLG